MRENIHVSPISSTGQTCTYLPQVIHVQAMLVLLEICVLMSYLPKVIQVLLVGVEAFVWVSVCPGQDYLNVQLLKQKKILLTNKPTGILSLVLQPIINYSSPKEGLTLPRFKSCTLLSKYFLLTNKPTYSNVF